MTIRIFNPDHDLALAANQERFTAPHAGRQLRSDLGFIPALWAEDGDVVVVDDIDAAESCLRKTKVSRKAKVEFVTMMQLKAVVADSIGKVKLDVWGWNLTLRQQLMRSGIPEEWLPSLYELERIRDLSSRRITTDILKRIRDGIESETCGESTYCENAQSVRDAYYPCVIKALWSSSGRGVRYLNDEFNMRIQNTWNWVQNTIDQQGGIMVEPYYNKIKDFALEFLADEDGHVSFCGISLFDTLNGAYTGNVLCSEEEKRAELQRYTSQELLDTIISRIEQHLNVKPYTGPLGIDMMIVAEHGKFLIHPCVEINLRRTMGHVALSLTPAETFNRMMMRVNYRGKKYHLNIEKPQ